MVDLLMLDDWGPDRLSASQRRDPMGIVEDRYGRGSTLITMPTAPDSMVPQRAKSKPAGKPTLRRPQPPTNPPREQKNGEAATPVLDLFSLALVEVA
jgi:hypothetical protein